MKKKNIIKELFAGKKNTKKKSGGKRTPCDMARKNCEWCACDNPTIWPFSGCNVCCGARCPPTGKWSEPTEDMKRRGISGSHAKKKGEGCCALTGRDDIDEVDWSLY